MPQELNDRYIRHQIFIQRFGGGEVRKTLPFLRRLSEDLRKRLIESNITQFQRDRLIQLELDINSLINEAITGIQEHTQKSMIEFAAYEAGFNVTMMQAVSAQAVASVDINQVRSAITTRPMELVSGKNIKRLTMQQAFRDFSETASKEVRRTIQSGIVEGKTTDQLVRDVSRIVNTRTRKQAEALIRTVTNHAANVARSEVMAQNDDLIEGEKFLATLDSRTTMTCAGFDGKVFNINEGPHPALHWNCRSTRIPVIKEQYRIVRQGERASSEGPVDSRTTYGGFLKRQSDDFQNEVLGKERADLFRSGQVSIERFTDDLGRVYSLDELKARENLTL